MATIGDGMVPDLGRQLDLTFSYLSGGERRVRYDRLYSCCL